MSKKTAQEKDAREILIHYGEEDVPFNAVSPPIYQTSIFSFDTLQAFQEAVRNEYDATLYTRGNNPTVNLVEEKIALLEKAEAAKLFSSGSAAISSSILAFVEQGDHIIAVRDCYSWARKIVSSYLARFGVTYTFVRGDSLEEIEQAVRPNTRLIYLESPTSLTFMMQDIAAISALAKARGIKTVLDNTWATPLFQNPIELGIDLVVHSASKYLGGHSDILGGVVAGNLEDMRRIFSKEFLQLGQVPDPFSAWLMLRGMRTLPIRMEQHQKSAKKIVEALKEDERIKHVFYPWDSSHPQYALAQRQMRGGSSVFGIELQSPLPESIYTFVNGLKFFRIACSWGGYESLAVAVTPPYLAEKEECPVVGPFIRLYIGLESPDILLLDLKQSLDRLP